ncbi:hypothetical protein D9M70_483680 [compost metagenome]
MGKLVTAGTVHLRNGADAQGILGADALAAGDHLAAGQQGQQIGAHHLHAGMGLEGDDGRIEGGDLSAQGLETHGTDHVGPAHQTLGVVQRQAGQAGHAGQAVDQAEPVLGTQAHGFQAFGRQCLGGGHHPAAIADLADAEQGDADVGHMGQVAHRPLGRYLRSDPALEQRQQRLHHRALQTRAAMTVVGDGAADDGAGLVDSQHRTDAAGMAEQRIA